MTDNYPFLCDGYGLADYIVRTINHINESDWYGDFLGFCGCSNELELLDKISHWSRYCILHYIIDSAIGIYITWYAEKITPEDFVNENIHFITNKGIDSGLRILNSDYDSEDGSELDELYSDLIENVSDYISEACFIILFSDRDFLCNLQRQISNHTKNLKKSDYPDHLVEDGVIKRPTKSFPVWLKKAVFFRDKGRCQICGCDLTNTYILNNSNIDHMIPLKSSGNNDPTNLQLTCEHCNKSKGKKLIVKKAPTQRYW